MRKFFCFCVMVALLFVLPSGFSQNRVTFTENFNGSSNSFSRNPSSAWTYDTLLSVSGKAAWGAIPNAEGDSIELISPVYDLTKYAFAYLRFAHICKVSDEDIVSVEYKENFIGAKWTPLPIADYKGKCATYRKQRTFHQGSYTAWLKNDMLAQPDNSWWQTESFDVSADVSYAEVQFKFKVKKGKTIGTNFAWGWFIDNFELIASTTQINPPVVEFVSPFTKGTVYDAGPYTIYAKAAKRTSVPLQTPVLRLTYTELNGTVVRDSLLMKRYEGDSMWSAEIPQQKIGTNVAYTVYATDTVGNNAFASSSYIIGRKWGFDSNSVAILSIDTPYVGALAGSPARVVVNIENRGLKNLTSAKLDWSVNGVSQTPVKWVGNLNEGFKTQVLLGTYMPTANNADSIVVKISNPNNDAVNNAEDTVVSKVVYACTSIPSGTYSVNAMGLGTPTKPVYKSISAALEAIRTCGSSGNIVISLPKGSYSEDIEIVDFMKYMAPGSSLTIESATGKPEDVVITGSSPTSTKISIIRSANINIRNITLQGKGSGVEILDTNCNVEISGCRILLDTTITTAEVAIGIAEGTPNKIRILNNYMEGAYYGLYTRGVSATQPMTNITFSNNVVRSSYYGNYMYYTDFDYIRTNTITTRTDKAASFYGLDMTYCNAEEVSGNRIHATTSVTGGQGIYAYYFNQDSNRRGLFYNNEIIYNASGTAYGLYVGYGEMEFYHNTVIMYGAGASRAVYCNNYTQGMSMHFYNNNFVCYNSGYPMYFVYNTFIGSDILLDYNNCYGNTYVGYISGNKMTLNEWATATMDQNASNTNPSFQNYERSGKCLHYTGLSCPQAGGIVRDILDSVRDTQTAMGCYTSVPVNFDAALLRFVDVPSPMMLNNAVPVKVRMMNSGSKTNITSARIEWKANGVSQTAFNFTGNLAPYADTVLTIGQMMPIEGNNTIKAWFASVNGKTSDDNVEDDTISTSSYGCKQALSGVFTVGGTNPDYKTLEDAMYVLNTCGIGGPVTIKLAAGIYNPIDINGTFPGMSKTNTLTFTSQDLNNRAAIAGSTFGVQLTSASHYRFDNIVFNCQNSTYGIRIMSAADNIQITHCQFNMNPSITSTQYAIYLQSGAIRNDIHIIGNRINGGYYGIYFYGGTNSTPSQHGLRNRIDSNVITNTYNYNVYAYYSDFISISHNSLTCRSANAYSYFYGIYSYYGNIDLIEGNKIDATYYDKFSYAYCIYVNYSNNPSYQQSANDTTKIYNNEIRCKAVSYTYPVYCYYSRAHIYHNSIYAMPSGTTGYGIYANSNANTTPVIIKNNNVCLMGATSGYPVYAGGTVSYFQFDHNNYYGTGTYWAYMGGARSTLAAVQTYDKNAVRVLPDFLNPGSDLKIAPLSSMECPTAVSKDFTGAARSATTHMGCYNASVLKYNARISAFVKPTAMASNFGTKDSVVVTIENRASLALTSLTINWKVNGVSQTPVKWTGNLQPKGTENVALGTFTLNAGSNDIVVYCELPNGQQDEIPEDDTLSYNMYGCSVVALKGNYTVGGTNPNFKSMAEALSALENCGIAGPVTISLAAGTYPSMIINGLFPGSSATNTVTFTSQSGKAEDVYIGNDYSTALLLKDAAHVFFRKVTIGNYRATVGVEIENVPTNVHFEHCNIFVDTNVTTTGTYGVHHDQGSVSNIYWEGLYFIGNHVDGGYANFWLYPYSSGNTGAGIIVDSNLMTNAYYCGYYNRMWGHNKSFNYNVIRSRQNTTAAYYATYFDYYPVVDTMVGNQIYITNAGSANAYGIYLGSTINRSNTSNWAYCANNEVIINGTSSGTNYGIYAYTGNCGGSCWARVNYYYNTSHVVGTGTCYALYYYKYCQDASYGPCRAYYNNLYVDGGSNSAAVYFDDISYATSAFNRTDYNNYVSKGSYLADLAGTKVSTLAAIRKATGQDVSSVSENPNFTQYPANTHTSGSKMVVETDLTLPRYDKDNVKREDYTNMGCYHDFVPSKYDVKAVEFTRPINSSVVGVTDSVAVTITNIGKEDVSSVEIHWMANGVVKPTVMYKNALKHGEVSKSISLGTYVPVSGNNVLVAWTEKPDGYTDANPFNDTVRVEILGCDSALAGTYRVGASSAAIYPTVDKAIEALSYCGISAPVVFEIESGDYGSISLSGQIAGSSDVNTVTFVSLSRNKESVTIGADEATALTLNGVKHVHFKYLTLGSTGAKTMYCVKISGVAHDLQFYHCNLYASVSTTSSSSAIVHYPNASSPVNYMSNVRFIGNEMRGGYYGLYLYYAGGNAANCKTSAATRASIVIDSNTISDVYYYSVYSYYHTHIESFSHNVVTPRSSSGYHYGLYFSNYNLVDRIEGNRIHMINTTYAYPMYLYGYLNATSTFGTDVDPCLVTNNEIICDKGTYSYGMNTYYSRLNAINNSWYMYNSTTNYGLYLGTSNASSEMNFLNNIIVCDRAGTNYGVYVTAAATLTTYPTTLDYNDYYSSKTANLLYCGGIKTLANWQTTYNMDAHSVQVKPDFNDFTVDLSINNFSDQLKCNRNNVVRNDINGDARTTLTIMGAYSTKLFEGNDLQMEAYVEPTVGGIQCFPNSTPVKVCIYNMGTKAADFSAKPVTLYLKCESDSVNFTTNVKISTGGIGVMKRDTFELIANMDITYSGLYKLTAWLDWGMDEMASDDTLKLDYYVDKSILPYDNDFTGAFAGVATNQAYGNISWEVSEKDLVLNPVFGTGSLIFRSSEARGSISHALFTSVSLQGTYNPQLYFWYAHDNKAPYLRDQMEVRISQDGGATFKTLQTLYRYDAKCTTPTWKQYQIDLSNYRSGSCIIIAFTAYSFGGGDQSVDRVKIIAQQDMQVLVEAPSDTDFTACNLTGRNLTVYLENLTSQEVPFNAGDSITVEMSGASNFVYKKALTGRLENRQIDTLVLSPIDYVGGGQFDVKVYVNSIDSNAANDTAKFSLNLNPDLAIVSADAIGYTEPGDTMYASFTMKNVGNLDIVTPFDVRLLVNGEDTITERITSSLKVGDTLHYTFVQPYIVPATTSDQPFYLLDIAALLSCDVNADNDTARLIGNVNIVDNGILSITNPVTGKCNKGGEEVAVEVRLFNNGTVDGTDSLVLTAVIDSAGVAYKTLVEKLAPMYAGENRNHVFTQKYSVPRLSVNGAQETYKVTVYLSAAEGDIDLSNDTASVESCVEGGVGVAEAAADRWSMGQNIPNPAVNVTEVPFTLPEAGTVIFNIMGMNGQVLYREQVSAEAGQNRLQVNISDYAAGIYYYSMEYKGQRIVRKMNVTR